MITAQDVQTLRKATGAGMMDAKRALVDSDGDMDRAKDLLREQGLADAKKRSGRAQTEGSIGTYMHYQADRPVIGVLVELASETDFVAKSADFQGVANDLAMHVAAAQPTWVRRDEVPEETLEREKSLIAAQAENEGKPAHIIDKIVDGRLSSFYADNVLYDQKFVNPETFDGTIEAWLEQLTARLGENIGVTRFVRMAVGEGRD